MFTAYIWEGKTSKYNEIYISKYDINHQWHAKFMNIMFEVWNDSSMLKYVGLFVLKLFLKVTQLGMALYHKSLHNSILEMLQQWFLLQSTMPNFLLHVGGNMKWLT